ncbi:DUF4355 domain-containing protein [Salipaludibacillus sp. CF4.18]|uniref:DUF4355 domain-containing protein n=1 Tax=Salipaludibacillus sp. CF4.18 TaxID=3373081 RepID=UPI003EE62E0D
MTLEEIKAWLEENKESDEVKTYLGELKQPTRENVEGFLDTEEGKKLLQPRMDQNFTKGLNTWKEKNLDKLIDDEVKKKNPDKTPEQKELEELKQQFEQEKKERNREALKNKALTVADEKKLPKGILDFFIAEDEDGTTANLTKLEEEYNKAVQSAVDEKFKASGKEFKQGGSDNKASTTDISKLAKEASIRD